MGWSRWNSQVQNRKVKKADDLFLSSPQKANDLFLSSPHGVYKVIFELFASEKAQPRFDANPKTVIKEWKILWLPDKDIDRPKVDGISENKISDLKAFHGVGTRSLSAYCTGMVSLLD
jgi:hypothetical protein